jgi:hypothetical protein
MDEPQEEATFEKSVLLRLDELSRQLERVLTLSCPVCGPDMVRQIHPDSDWHTRATWALAGSNGSAHGE